MIYSALEDAIVTRLAPIVTAGHEVEAMPSKPSENRGIQHAGRITVFCGDADGNVDDIHSLTNDSVQDEFIKAHIVVRSKRLRTSGSYIGCYELADLARKLLLGWTPPNCNLPFKYVSFKLDDPDGLVDGEFSFVLQMITRTLAVPDYDAVDVVDITEITVTGSAQVGPIIPSVELFSSGYSVDNSGDQVILAWVSENADTVEIDNGVGSVEPNGSVTVSITETTTYTITVTNGSETDTASVTVSLGSDCDDATWSLIDEDGNAISNGTIASGDADSITAPNGEVTVNSTELGSGGADGQVLSNGDLNLGVTTNGEATGSWDGTKWNTQVLQDGSPVGSWDGSAWIISSCPTVVEATVALSDDAPKLGQVVTITATVIGVTPTSYTFYLPQLDGSYEEVTQAGSTYDWTVSKYEYFSVFVSVNITFDGLQQATGSAYGTTTGDVDADAIITAQETAIGGSMDATAQAWVLGFILRLKGIYTTLPENVFEQLSAANAELYAMFPDTSTTASVAGYSINAIDPTRNTMMVGFVAGDATVNGITGGSGKYMIMNNAPSDYGQNDASLHAYIRTASITCFIGAGDGSDIRDTSDVHSYMFGQTSDRIEGDINGDERDVPTLNGLQTNTGFCSIQRNKSDRLIFLNDEYVTDITPNNSITPSANFYYGMAGNASGTATRNSTSSVSCLINAPYLEECALTTLAEAVIWLQTQIGRNV
jgi:hypothetical protein